MNIKTKLREVWSAACRHDGIPEDSQFVVFSDDNPFVKEHAKWLKMYFAGERLKRGE